MANDRRVKVGGKVLETSQEELNTLAAQKGLPVKPITPVGAGLIGASPDQQKMVGTGEQKKAALAQVQQPTQTLAQAQRYEAGRTALTDAESLASQKAQQLQQFGSLNSRVQNLISNKIWENQQQAITKLSPVAEIDMEAYKGMGGTEATADELKTELEAYAAATDEQARLAQLAKINTMLGRDPTTVLSNEDLLALYDTTNAAVADTLAATMQDQVTMSKVKSEDLGFDSDQQIADLLGVPVEQLNQMTIGQVGEAARRLEQQELNRVDQLRAKLTDPTTGAAEREQARRELSELSQVGVTGVEDVAEKGTAQVEEANRIEFAGKQYEAIEDFLADEEVSSVIDRYLSGGDTDKQWLDTLRQQSPEFAKWIDENKEELDKLVEQAGGDAEELGAIQQDNADVAHPNGQTIPEEFMKLAYDSWGNIVADRYNPEDVGFMQAMHEASPEATRNILKWMGEANDLEFEDIMTDLKSLTADQIKELGLYVDGGGNFKNYLDYRSSIKKITEVNPSDLDSILDIMFGDVDTNDVKSQLSKLKTAEALKSLTGGNINKGSKTLLDLLDANRDGNIDNSAKIRKRLLNTTGKQTESLLEFLKDKSTPQLFGGANMANATSTINSMERLYGSILGYADKNGKFSNVPKKELKKLTTAQLEALFGNKKIAGHSTRRKAELLLEKRYGEKVEAVANKLASKSGFGSAKEAKDIADKFLNEDWNVAHEFVNEPINVRNLLNYEEALFKKLREYKDDSIMFNVYSKQYNDIMRAIARRNTNNSDLSKRYYKRKKDYPNAFDKKEGWKFNGYKF